MAEVANDNARRRVCRAPCRSSGCAAAAVMGTDAACPTRTASCDVRPPTAATAGIHSLDAGIRPERVHPEPWISIAKRQIDISIEDNVVEGVLRSQRTETLWRERLEIVRVSDAAERFERNVPRIERHREILHFLEIHVPLAADAHARAVFPRMAWMCQDVCVRCGLR